MTPHHSAVEPDGLRAPSIRPADIVWEVNQPVSARFGDVYFCHDNGLAESRYVFVDHNRLHERFQRVVCGQSFVIAEAGFGTGLNFLAAWQAWQQAEPAAGAVLHFVSVERYPLTDQDIKRALSAWPELHALADQLLSQYPPLVSGQHRLVFEHGQVRLTLYFGDALAAWDDMEFTADAWFLDGFTPALNPELWGDAIAHAVARHSRQDTTVATYTAAGHVRAALNEAGFEMQKVPGFNQKKVMLAGIYRPQSATSDNDTSSPRSITIIGAGIAGALLARNLAERGWNITVIDAGDSSATGASGNDQGALYVKLGVDFNDQSKLALAALLYSQRFYRLYATSSWHPTGLLQLAWSDHEIDRQARFCARNDYPSNVVRPVDRAEAQHLSGTAVTSGGLWYENSGWLEPAVLCRQLLQHPRIHCRFGFKVTRLMPCNGRWHVSGEGEQEVASDRLVLCAGHQTPGMLPVFGGFRFKSIRGQVTSLPEAAVHAPKAVVCGPCYLNPAHNGRCLSGATFDLHDPSPDLKLQSHEDNLQQLTAILPDIWTAGKPPAETLQGRVSFRCTTHDYQPAVGPLTDQNGQPLEGIDMLTGLGSKGLAYAPLLTEYLADYITGQPSALPRALIKRLLPDRCRVPAQQKSA